MKNTFRVFGIILIVFSLIMFMYGSIKTARAEDEVAEKIEIDGIQLVKQSESGERAKTAYIIGFVLLSSGIGMIVLAPSGKKRR